jgi:hypothetical protein
MHITEKIRIFLIFYRAMVKILKYQYTIYLGIKYYNPNKFHKTNFLVCLGSR